MTWSTGKPKVVRRLDFSEFHDGFHRIFSRTCWQQYGGPRRHVRMMWWLGWKDRTLYLPRRVKCLFGRHTDMFWARGDRSWARMICLGCKRERHPSEAELEAHPPIIFDLE